jgi:hypothetical protein
MFHFKTSPNSADNYLSGTIWGPYGGLRYYWKGTKPPAARR